MAKEKPVSVVEAIRKALVSGGGGGNMPEELFFVPKDGKKVVRFLSEFDKPVEIVMHDKYGYFMPQPCLKYYDEECPFHGRGFRTKTNYAWTVYDYESKQKKVFLVPPTQNSAMEDLIGIWDENGTLVDRDVRIKRSAGDKSTYRARDLAPSKFEGDFEQPFSEGRILKIVRGLIVETEIKANGDDDGDGDERPRGKDEGHEDERPREKDGRPRGKGKVRGEEED